MRLSFVVSKALLFLAGYLPRFIGWSSFFLLNFFLWRSVCQNWWFLDIFFLFFVLARAFGNGLIFREENALEFKEDPATSESAVIVAWLCLQILLDLQTWMHLLTLLCLQILVDPQRLSGAHLHFLEMHSYQWQKKAQSDGLETHLDCIEKLQICWSHWLCPWCIGFQQSFFCNSRQIMNSH